MLKKMLSIIMAAAMIFSLVGCGSMESPETSVTNYLNAVKTLDLETMAKYVGEEATEETLEADDEFEEYMMNELFGNMTYEIISSEENDDTATVKVAFTNVNMSVVLSEVITQAFSLIFSDLTEDEMNAKMEEFFMASMEKNKETLKTTEVDIELTKGEDHWIITPTEEMMDAIIGGLASSFENLG